jgi:hypothetical protein
VIITYSEHKILLRKLTDADVSFILIGGYAVNYHGYNRPTGDMDIWLKPDNDNRDKLMDLFVKERYERSVINELRKFDFTKTVVFHIGAAPKRIDFLTHINLVDYNDAWNEKKMLPLDDFSIPVLQLHHLVLSKMSTGRTRDKADIEELQKINQKKKPK